MLKGWTTFLLNALGAVAPVLQATGAADLGLSGNAAAIYATVLAVLNIVNRFRTTTPIFTK